MERKGGKGARKEGKEGKERGEGGGERERKVGVGEIFPTVLMKPWAPNTAKRIFCKLAVPYKRN